MDLSHATPAAPAAAMPAFAELASRFSLRLARERAMAARLEAFWAAAMGDDAAALDQAMGDPETLMAACESWSFAPRAAIAQRAADFAAPSAERGAVLARLLRAANLDEPIPQGAFPNSGERARAIGRNPRLLHWACAQGHEALALALLRAGASPDGFSPSAGGSAGRAPSVAPICLAFESDNLSLASALAVAGANFGDGRRDDPERTFLSLGGAILARALAAETLDEERQRKAFQWLAWADEHGAQLPSEGFSARRPAPDSALGVAVAMRQAMTALSEQPIRRPKGDPLSVWNSLFGALGGDTLPRLFFFAVAHGDAAILEKWCSCAEERGQPVFALSGVSAYAWLGVAAARQIGASNDPAAIESAMRKAEGLAETLRAARAPLALSPALGDADAALASALPPAAFERWRAMLAGVPRIEADEEAIAPEELFARKEAAGLGASLAAVGAQAAAAPGRKSSRL
jgi:hypothetical protein